MTANPFEGRLVRLRAREPDDEALLFRWFNDPEVTEHLGEMRYPVSHATERGFIERVHEVSFASASFAVVTREEHELIGGVDLRARPEDRVATLGIAIGAKERWDGGYGTDTMHVACRFGFEMMNLHRIQLTVSAANLRARHVWRRPSCRNPTRSCDDRFSRGKYLDTVVMGLLESELISEDES